MLNDNMSDGYSTTLAFDFNNTLLHDGYGYSNFSIWFNIDQKSEFSTLISDVGNITDSASETIFVLPVWRQIMWNFLFVCIVIVATTGNIIVIWIVLAHKRMRTVTNYFLVNLSIADAMVSTLNVTFNYTYMLNVDWPFGNLYCKISQFVAILSICASVFTLMAISMDRIFKNFKRKPCINDNCIRCGEEYH